MDSNSLPSNPSVVPLTPVGAQPPVNTPAENLSLQGVSTPQTAAPSQTPNTLGVQPFSVPPVINPAPNAIPPIPQTIPSVPVGQIPPQPLPVANTALPADPVMAAPIERTAQPASAPKTSLLPLILGVILVGGLGVGGFYWWSQSGSTQPTTQMPLGTPTPTVTPILEESEPLSITPAGVAQENVPVNPTAPADWQTYHNRPFSVAFQFPANWEVQNLTPYPREDIMFRHSFGPRENFVPYGYLEVSSLSPVDLIAQTAAEVGGTVTELPDGTVMGYQLFKRVITSTEVEDSTPIEHWFFPVQDKTYHIVASGDTPEIAQIAQSLKMVY